MHLTFHVPPMPDFCIDPISGVIILSGPNGVGKSRLIETLTGRSQFDNHNGRSHSAMLGPLDVASVLLDGERLATRLVTTSDLAPAVIPTPRNTSSSLYAPSMSDRTRQEIAKLKDGKSSELITPEEEKLFRGGDISEADLELRIELRAGLNMTALIDRRARYHERYADLKYEGCPLSTIEAKIGPDPLNEINQTLEKFALPYELMGPDLASVLPNRASYQLRHKESREIVNGRLSAGQRVAVAIYNAVIAIEKTPTLLFLDDLDGMLDPETLQRLYHRTKDELESRNSLAAWVTHSPVLCQIANEASCFYIEKLGDVPRPVTRMQTIHLLTAGRLTVTDATRVVFVEGSDDASGDARFYSTVYHRLVSSGDLVPQIPLRFVPTSKRMAGGSRDAVENVVEILRTLHLGALFWGLTDGDNGSAPPPNGVVRLRRYCLENYWADPLIAYSMLITDWPNDIPPAIDFGLNSGDGPHVISKLSSEQLQAIVDWFAKATTAEFDIPGDGIAIEVGPGKVLSYPTVFIKSSGKELINRCYVRMRDIPSGQLNCENLRKHTERGWFWPPDLIETFKTLTVGNPQPALDTA